jgi:hypothetical protein
MPKEFAAEFFDDEVDGFIATFENRANSALSCATNPANVSPSRPGKPRAVNVN